MIKKLIITPFFGDLPEWMDDYIENIESLKKYGYDWLPFYDVDEFSKRIREKLGIEPDIRVGTSDPHNFRTAYGVLFEEELEGYDFWGITDLDCVYGRIKQFMPDSALSKLDVWSNHHNYVCGPWTMFRNTEKVNRLFELVPNWQGHMMAKNDHPGRWTEQEFSKAIEEADIALKYTHFQGKDPSVDENLHWEDDILMDGEDEIMMFHFNRKKRWPINL